MNMLGKILQCVALLPFDQGPGIRRAAHKGQLLLALHLPVGMGDTVIPVLATCEAHLPNRCEILAAGSWPPYVMIRDGPLGPTHQGFCIFVRICFLIVIVLAHCFPVSFFCVSIFVYVCIFVAPLCSCCLRACSAYVSLYVFVYLLICLFMLSYICVHVLVCCFIYALVYFLIPICLSRSQDLFQQIRLEIYRVPSAMLEIVVACSQAKFNSSCFPLVSGRVGPCICPPYILYRVRHRALWGPFMGPCRAI